MRQTRFVIAVLAVTLFALPAFARPATYILHTPGVV